MSAAKHTEGPWSVDGPLDVVPAGGRCLTIDAHTGAGRLTVATVGYNEEEGEEGLAACRADARLIAAAPTMRARLIEAATHLENVCECANVGDCEDAVRRAVDEGVRAAR